MSWVEVAEQLKKEIMCVSEYLLEVHGLPPGRKVLNLRHTLMSMNRLIANYETVYLSNGYLSHAIYLESSVRRDIGKLPPFLVSVS